MQNRTETEGIVLIESVAPEIVLPAEYRLDWEYQGARERVAGRRSQMWSEPNDSVPFTAPTAWQVRAVPLAAGISQKEAAQRLGISARFFREWAQSKERRKVPRFRDWVALLNACGMAPPKWPKHKTLTEDVKMNIIRQEDFSHEGIEYLIVHDKIPGARRCSAYPRSSGGNYHFFDRPVGSEMIADMVAFAFSRKYGLKTLDDEMTAGVKDSVMWWHKRMRRSGFDPMMITEEDDDEEKN